MPLITRSIRALMKNFVRQDHETSSIGEITTLLSNWNGSDPEVGSRLFALTYPELKRIARARMLSEHNDHTLQPTALVGEFFLILARDHNVKFKNRSHFLAVASCSMRRVLIDHARASAAQKRNSPGCLVQLEGLEVGSASDIVDTLAIDEALTALEAEEPRMAKVVELRCFGGLTHAEIAEVLDIDERTSKRDWQVARAWLFGRLKGGHRDEGGTVGRDQKDL